MARGDVFTTIRSEGALLPADFLQKLVEPKATLDGLAPPDYHLPGTEKLNEAASRAWNHLIGVWAAFQSASQELKPGDRTTTITREKWLLPLFQELGYGRLQAARAFEIDGKAYAISHSWQQTPIHLVGRDVDLDRRTPGVAGAARTSPHGLLQEFLNRSEGHLWGLVSNGLKLRLLRDNRSFTRQAFVEFDLAAMMDGQVFADFVLLWIVCHQSRVEGERPDQSWLEKWTEAAKKGGTRALDDLRDGVERAIEALGRGFLKHPANSALKGKLSSGSLTKQDYYRQLLREVYRLIFLFVAEDRELLLIPSADAAARERYNRFYSVARLRRLAERRRGTPHDDLWRGLSLVFAKLSSRAGAPELALPALGSFLWSEKGTPDLDTSAIANVNVLDAIRALAFTAEDNIRRAVDYRNLGPEELGSVYESLLELQPDLNADAGTFELRTAPGHERKTTGSYYTPTALIESLLDSALDPVLDEAAKKPDAATGILRLKVCDPACGSGHFLIAAAHRIAKRLAAARTGDEEPSPAAVRSALRDVVGHCIYGVDVNPMAVELCKVNLWLEALEPGKPLSFLEHHVQRGNSLLGATPKLLAAGIPDEAFDPVEGDDKEVCQELKRRNKRERDGFRRLPFEHPWDRLGDLANEWAQLDEGSDDTVDGVREKERRWEQHVQSVGYTFGRLWADAWSAAFLFTKSHTVPATITEDTFRMIERNPNAVPKELREAIRDIAERHGVFHWHFAFPNVFRVPKRDTSSEGERPWIGGFDAVVGNPPWVSLTGRFSSDTAESAYVRFGTFRHRTNTYMPNTYEMFVRAALELTQDDGYTALLLPERFAFNVYVQPSRTLILQRTSLARLSFRVPFPGVTVDVLAFSARNTPPAADHEFPAGVWGSDPLPHRQNEMLQHPTHAFEYFTDRRVQALVTKLADHSDVVRLDNVCTTTSGFGGKSAAVTPERRGSDQIEVLKGESISRFAVTHSFYFEFVRQNITGRTTDKSKLGAALKILLRKTGDSIIATLDVTGRFPEQSLYFLFNIKEDVDPRYLLGVVNSRLMNYYFRTRCLTNADSIAQVKKVDLDSLPIRLPRKDVESDQRNTAIVVACVVQLLSGAPQTSGADDVVRLEATIDGAVYELYGLTDEERALVESAGKAAHEETDGAVAGNLSSSLR